MKKPFLIVAALLFCAVWSFLGDLSPWAEVVGNSWVPYVAVPYAVGLATPRVTLICSGLEGALTSVAMVTAFYLVVIVDDGYFPTNLFVLWGTIGTFTGAAFAVTAWALISQESASRRRALLLGSCAMLTFAHVGMTVVDGWGIVEVQASSGVVYVGASTLDIIVSTVILLGSAFGAIAFALARPTLEGQRRGGRGVAQGGKATPLPGR